MTEVEEYVASMTLMGRRVTVDEENGEVILYRADPASRLKEFILPDFITHIGDMALNRNEYLERLVLNNGLKGIYRSAFSKCSKLVEVVIPESVTEIGEFAFSMCNSLEKVNIPKGVRSLREHTFFGCVSLRHIELPENMLFIGDSAFNNCFGLRRVDIPDGVIRVGEWAFHNCSDELVIYCRKDSSANHSLERANIKHEVYEVCEGK